MSATGIALLLLGFVDVAALSIGISIRRKVTRQVAQTASVIEDNVKEGISEAVERFVALAGQLFVMQGRPELAERIDDVLEELRR